jgi:alkylhydroperoxidase/carboxymuconolactone decarboxylase family protein YurZ
MSENPLEIFQKMDPDLLKLADETRSFALTDGALPRKFKLLVAMALDASQGTVEGVRALAQLALNSGATKEEIMEVVRVAQYICGVGCVYVSARAFKDIF